MILDDLGDYLSTGGLGLTSGTNLFLGTWPDAPDTACAIYETGGFFPIHTMSASAGNAAVERPRVQITTRAVKYQTARQLMHNVFQRLDGVSNQTIGSTRYLSIVAVSSPAAMGTDASGRARFVVNMDIIKKLHTSTST
ncbi:MAG TPA: minor capsid protein [Candidatus Binatia bacterium]|nr:minor capsid protein [Candidatus Binatia bacterium]